MNSVMLIGRLTNDVEVKYTSTQMAVARFSLALNRGRDKDGNDRGADFPSIVAFGRTAENLEKFSGKGLRVFVDGHIQTGKYEKDGHTVYTTDVIANRIEFIDWKDKSGDELQEEAPKGFQALNEDVPF